jgi:hypothetical protein
VEDDEDDLESYWKDVQAATPLKRMAGTGNTTPIYVAFEAAAAKAKEDMAKEAVKFLNQPLSPEVLSAMISVGLQKFLNRWYDELRTVDFSTLIAVILEGKEIPVSELKEFVRALPGTLLERLVGPERQEALPTRTGAIHALLAVEYHFRNNRLTMRRDYELQRDLTDDMLTVTVYTAMDAVITFRLDERFDLAGPQPAAGVQTR